MNEFYFATLIVTTAYAILAACPKAMIAKAYKIFNSSSFYSRQRVSDQYPMFTIFFVQGVGVCQAIAVIHSRIMEESPNSFPKRL